MRTLVLALALAACAGPTRELTQAEETAVSEYRRGLELVAAGRHEEALAVFETVRAKAWTPHVDVALARTLGALGREGQACRVWASLEHEPTLRNKAQAGDERARDAARAIEAASAVCWKDGIGLSLPARGEPDAPVTILMVGEYQCPYCRRAEATMRQIAEAWPKEVRFAWVHRPLPFHVQADPAARTAVAAQMQGRFWEMHDVLMTAALESDGLDAIAERAGVDVERLRRDREDPGVSAFVRRNDALALALEAPGTPTFYINGKRVAGAQSFEKFKESIDAALAEARAESARGTPPERLHETLSARANPTYLDLVIRGRRPPAPPAAAAPVTRRVDETVWRVDVLPTDAADGPVDALVTVVQFGDYQCPFTARVAPTFRELRKLYGDDVRIVFKHLPLAFHPHARSAARAAVAAQALGRFWQLHDILLANPRDLDPSKLTGHAVKAGLDRKRFEAELARPATEQRVVADLDLAKAVEANGTPHFFVNGRRLPGAQQLVAFRELVDQELAKARQKVRDGTHKATLYETIVRDGRRNR